MDYSYSNHKKGECSSKEDVSSIGTITCESGSLYFGAGARRFDEVCIIVHYSLINHPNLGMCQILVEAT